MNLSDFLSHRAAESPHAIAALSEQNNLTSQQLDRLAWQIVTRLRRIGLSAA